MRLQHLVKAQLILCCHSEVAHLTINTFQDLVIDKEFLANFCIYPQLIPNNIPKRRLISIKDLSVTTLLAVVERKVGLVPP
jgi:hypothetical protein